KGLEIAPDDKDLYLNMGLVFLNAKKFESAMKCYSKAVSLDRTNILGFFGLGVCHAELGNIPAAKACFAYVLRLDPHNVGAKEWMKKIKS
ncbi:TPA: tetratricopeptide repeat protein, partial [Candidatus Woesearchaeota archaeon]|nr:tetratricopeptide repeat protein [Candidatus Woesearchaeota archaeon]